MFGYVDSRAENNAFVPASPVQRPSMFGWGRSRSRSVFISTFCPRGKTVFFGRRGYVSDCMDEWIGLMGGSVTYAEEAGAGEDWLRRLAPRLDFILVDESAAEDIRQLVEHCLFLRRALPEVPLLLLSPSVKGDDFGTERMAICDVTLRTPLSQAAFVRALRMARSNNRRYVGSLAAPQPSALRA